jgi:hypothetical protein
MDRWSHGYINLPWAKSGHPDVRASSTIYCLARRVFLLSGTPPKASMDRRKGTLSKSIQKLKEGALHLNPKKG